MMVALSLRLFVSNLSEDFPIAKKETLEKKR